MPGTTPSYPDYSGPEKCEITWTFRLGDWVRCQAFRPMGVFIVVWREYRETPWGERQQYGLLPIEDLDLDPHAGAKVFNLEIGDEDDLTPYDGDEDGQLYQAKQVEQTQRYRHGEETNEE